MPAAEWGRVTDVWRLPSKILKSSVSIKSLTRRLSLLPRRLEEFVGVLGLGVKM